MNKPYIGRMFTKKTRLFFNPVGSLNKINMFSTANAVNGARNAL